MKKCFFTTAVFMLLLSSLILTESSCIAYPLAHPIYGTATWEEGGNAVGALVSVHSSLGTLTTTVGSEAEWQVDCGEPGPSWPEGTAFTVTITGSGVRASWFGNKSGIVSGYYNDMGNIVLKPGTASSDNENTPPIADASAAEPYSGMVGEQIIFDGSRSYDPDEEGYITLWLWDFGDGTTDTGVYPIHIYNDTGNYLVTLTVTDNWGKTGVYTTSIQITETTNHPPETPDIVGPTIGSINTTYSYSIVGLDMDGDNISYSIDWGDSTNSTSDFFTNGTAYNISHIWKETGTFSITAYTIDNLQAISESRSLSVVIAGIQYLGDIGYLLDDNNDGIYEIYHSNETGEVTSVELQKDGTYKIDTDGDGVWNYIYDPVAKQIIPSNENQERETTRFPWLLLLGISIALALIAIIVYLYKKEYF